MIEVKTLYIDSGYELSLVERRDMIDIILDSNRFSMKFDGIRNVHRNFGSIINFVVFFINEMRKEALNK